MSFETALRARIKAGLATAGKAASVEWGKRPQGKYPAIVLTTVSLPIGRHMTGSNGARPQRVQIDVFGLDKGLVTDLRETVLTIIAPPELTGGVRFGPAQSVTIADLSEQTETEFVFRDMIDAILWHQLEN